VRRGHLPLASILGVAVALRLWGIDFGLPHTLARPDEDAVASIALRFFRRELNPGFFDWPSLFTYLVAVGYAAYFNIGRLIGWFPYEATFITAAGTTPAPLFLIARGLSAAAGVATVGVVYAIGAKLFDRVTALMAAMFMAVAALHVRDSHFGVTDVTATCFLATSFLFTARFARTGRISDALYSALFAGMAASTKYNAGVTVLPGLWAILNGETGDGGSRMARLRLSSLYVVVAASAFVVGTPYAVLDSGAFLAALRDVGAHLQGGHAALAGPAWAVHLTSSLRFGLGVPMLVAGIGGVALYCWRDRRAGVLFALLPCVYFAIIGIGQTAFARHIIPTLPFLCLGAAYFTTEATRTIGRRVAQAPSALVLGWSMAVIVAAPSAWSAVQTDRLLSRTDSRVLAAAWIRQQFTGGATIYQSGSSYAHVQMPIFEDRSNGGYREVAFDDASGTFLAADGARTESPDLIVRPQCALSYCDAPPRLATVLDGYTPLATFVAVDVGAAGRLVYDRDDAFFVPLAGFSGAIRPGPDEVIYVRRGR